MEWWEFFSGHHRLLRWAYMLVCPCSSRYENSDCMTKPPSYYWLDSRWFVGQYGHCRQRQAGQSWIYGTTMTTKQNENAVDTMPARLMNIMQKYIDLEWQCHCKRPNQINDCDAENITTHSLAIETLDNSFSHNRLEYLNKLILSCLAISIAGI